MVIKPTLVLAYEFDGKPQRVFDAFTQPEHLNKWCTSNAQVNLQIGGKMTNADGDNAKFTKVAVPRELVFTYTHPKLEVETEVDITFKEFPILGRTQMRIVQKGLDPKKVSKESYVWMADRWGWMADNLKRYLEKNGRIDFEVWRSKRQPVYGVRQ